MPSHVSKFHSTRLTLLPVRRLSSVQCTLHTHCQAELGTRATGLCSFRQTQRLFNVSCLVVPCLGMVHARCVSYLSLNVTVVACVLGVQSWALRLLARAAPTLPLLARTDRDLVLFTAFTSTASFGLLESTRPKSSARVDPLRCSMPQE